MSAAVTTTASNAMSDSKSATKKTEASEAPEKKAVNEEGPIYVLVIDGDFCGSTVAWFSSRAKAEKARDIAKAGGYPELSEHGDLSTASVETVVSGTKLKLAEDFVYVPSPAQQSWVKEYKVTGKVGRCENGEGHWNLPSRPVAYFERHLKYVCQSCYLGLFDYF